MHHMLQDLRVTIRQLRKSPGFALTTILTLALGIGATTAIFSLINAVLLRPLPFPQPDRLTWMAEKVPLGDTTRNEVGSSLSYPDFFDWRTQNHSFETIASYHDNDFTLIGSGEPKHLYGDVVSADFFRTLGVNPALGRGFNAGDEKAGANSVVLSHQLWQSSFGSSPDIVGRAINIDNKSYTVVGVMPAGFAFPIQNPPAVLWTSLGDDAGGGEEAPTAQRGMHMLDVVGRLKPGVSLAQAQADMNLIAVNLAKQYPNSNKHFDGAVIMSQLERMVGDTRTALRVLFAAVAFVLLIACVNVAGLLLARASRRRSEIALRAALGATRGEIIRQVLVESVFLSVCGGLLGVCFAVFLLRIAMRVVPDNLPRLDQVSVDARVMGFAILISVLTGLLFGVLPAWRMSRLDPSLALREGSRSLGPGRGQHRLHDWLVIAETAIGLVLLVGAGLLIHSFVRILQVDPGFDSRNILTASIALPDNRYNAQQQVQFFDQLLPKLAALPGVQSAAAGWALPFAQNSMAISFDIEGHSLAPGDQPAAGVHIATPGYLETLHIPVLRGRSFRPEDTAKSTPVMALNESFAHKYFPNEDPIGKRVRIGLGDGTVSSKSMREIIAVVGDVRERKLTKEAKPEYFLPYSQAAVTSPTLVIRSAVDPTALIGPVRAQVAAIDKTVPFYDVKTMDDIVSQAAAQPRFQAVLFGFFAAMALLLSAVGLYAVLSYMVAQRTMEIGLRLALGAQRENVLAMILRRGLILAGTGLAIGVAVSLVLTRFLQGMLYGVRPFDPLTFAAVSLTLLLVSLAASCAPAYRAGRLDPMLTLREQ